MSKLDYKRIEAMEDPMNILCFEMTQLHNEAPRTKHDVVQELKAWTSIPDPGAVWDQAVEKGIIVKTGKSGIFGYKYKLADGQKPHD